MGQWDAAGLLGPAVGPFDSRSGWERRSEDGAVVVTTEFTLKPRAPKARLSELFYKVGARVCGRERERYSRSESVSWKRSCRRFLCVACLISVSSVRFR